MRIILVPVADRPECAVALGEAFPLAARLGANVVGCHIRPDADHPVAVPAGIVMAPSLAALAPVDRAAAEVASRDAKHLFTEMAALHGVKLAKKPGAKPVALWQERLGSLDHVMPIAAPLSDLVVVSRPLAKSAGRAHAFLLAALMNGVRPVLILPQKKPGSLGRHILIAWDNSVGAGRAVASALPLIKAAATVTILSAGEMTKLGPNARELGLYLAHHGVAAEVVVARKDGRPQALVDAYRKLDADLVVMGAYSRSYLRELVFGGATHHMLFKADIPVVMQY